ncbi:MAG: ABC transporter permease [Chloroflexi bacterium]|nr:ABC transporter permease [Chloroflexota bacterium]
MENETRNKKVAQPIGKRGEAYQPAQTLWRRALLSIRHDRQTMVALSVLSIFALIGLMAPLISEALDLDPIEQDVRNNYAPLGTEGHLLGTDELGRDHFARLLFAGQISLGIAIASAFLGMGIGVAVGSIAGFYGGVVDDIVIWFTATWTAIPGLLLLIIVSSLFSLTPFSMVFLLGILGWAGVARLVRAETISIKERDFVLAARATGASNLRIMFLHIVPNMFSLLIIILSQSIGGLILIESALSFIGFGIKAPTPTWGNMLTSALDYMRRGPHLMMLPGMLITVTVFCLYVIGDGLRDAFDPKIAD